MVEGQHQFFTFVHIIFEHTLNLKSLSSLQKGFERDNFNIKRKFKNLWNFSSPKQDKKMWVFSQRESRGQTNSYIKMQLVPIIEQKEFLKYIHTQKSNGTLKPSKSMEVKQKFINIHSFIQIVCGFHLKESRWNTIFFNETQFFSMKKFQGFPSEILIVISLFGGKFLFPNPLDQPQF